MDKPSSVFVIYIVTTPEKLWAALTNGEITQRASTQSASKGATVAGRLSSADSSPCWKRVVRCRRSSCPPCRPSSAVAWATYWK